MQKPITRDDGLRIIALLWEDKFQLTKKYFGKYLSQLIQMSFAEQFEGRFIRAAFFPETLEKTLLYIEPLGQTAAIVSEIGNIQDVDTLDARILDAMAELRTITQLCREGFSDIRKVGVTADLTAIRANKSYAFQVKRINTALREQVVRRNDPDKRDDSPYGEISDIHARLDNPASWFFWDTIDHKNVDLKS